MVKYVIQANDSVLVRRKKYWSKSNTSWVSADLCSPVSYDVFGVYYNTRQDAEKALSSIRTDYPLATVETVSDTFY